MANQMHIRSHTMSSEKKPVIEVPMGTDNSPLAMTYDGEGNLKIDFTAPGQSEHRLRDLYVLVHSLSESLRVASAAEDAKHGISRPQVAVEGRPVP